jgi:hypothetical protein
VEISQKNGKNVKKPILLKKTPAENACAFAQGGVYTHLSKIMQIYGFFRLFQACFSGTFVFSCSLSSARTIFVFESAVANENS